jgi:hypothetical protein
VVETQVVPAVKGMVTKIAVDENAAGTRHKYPLEEE